MLVIFWVLEIRDKINRILVLMELITLMGERINKYARKYIS